MTSLKGYTPELARHLGTTPAALYERQRALVRAELLDPIEGRGPGHGVRTTAGHVGLLVIAALAADSLAETENRTRAIAYATPAAGDERCPMTSMPTFLEAFASVLMIKERSRAVREISISRTAALAQIRFQSGNTAKFAGSQSTEPGLRIVATLARKPFLAIADEVQALQAEVIAHLSLPTDSEQIEQTWNHVIERMLPGHYVDYAKAAIARLSDPNLRPTHRQYDLIAAARAISDAVQHGASAEDQGELQRLFNEARAEEARRREEDKE
jgi:hypothetical protein